MRTLAFVQKSQRESIYANVIHAGSRGEYCENLCITHGQCIDSKRESQKKNVKSAVLMNDNRPDERFPEGIFLCRIESAVNGFPILRKKLLQV